MAFIPAESKQEALDRLCDALGLERHPGITAKGSSIPEVVFMRALEVTGVPCPEAGGMPAKARAVVEAAGLPWGSDCDSTQSESGGGSTVTLTGLNRILEVVEGRLSIATLDGPNDLVGATYRPAHGNVDAPPSVLVCDWDALDRATQSHNDTQNGFAEWLTNKGVRVFSPKFPEPNTDVGWEYGQGTPGDLAIAEVKSVTSGNRRQQFRLGLGQVLDHRMQLANRTGRPIAPVLVLSDSPTQHERDVAASAGVVVTSPESFDSDLAHLI